MKQPLLTAFNLMLMANTALAQTPVTPYVGNGPVTATNPLPTTGTLSATISGFAPNGAYASLTASSLSSDTTLPSSATVVIGFNTGTTPVSCILSVGASVATASKNIIQPGSWLAFTVGSNTHVSCINQSGIGSNVVVFSGGDGIPTGSGGSVNCSSASPCVVDANSTSALIGAINGPIPGCSTSPCTTVIGVTPQSMLYGGVDTKVIADPCMVIANSYTPISIASSTPVNIVSGVSSEKTYICQIVLQNNAAESVLVVEATTGSTCGTISAGVFGSSVAGFNFSANGGISIGNGMHSVARTATANDDLCIIQSTATQLTGGVTWVRSS